MHNDASNIFNLYMEAVEEQPLMTTDKHGNKQWKLHGKLHRVDAPAIEKADGSKTWFLHGNLHRDDGPAHENPHTGYKAWYLHNKAYAKPELWAKDVLKERNKPHDADAISEFLVQILGKYIE